MTQVRVLTSEDIGDLVDPAGIVDAVRDGYRERGEGAPARPRTRLKHDDPPGLITGYTAILPGLDAMGGYMYSAGFADQDAWFPLPLFDAQSGELIALIDGSRLNPVKTGAASAVAVDELAREDAGTLALIGSGRQAYGQFRCIHQVRTLEHVRVYSPTPEHRAAFATHLEDEHGVQAEACASAQQALDGAGIVVTATRSGEPVFDGRDLEDGTHATAMGQYHPRRREVDARTVARSTYVVDLRERVRQDSGAFLLAQQDGAVGADHVHAELGAVVAGLAPGRRSNREVTLFDSGGTAIETVAAARYVYDEATREDRGHVVEFEPASEGMPRPW